MPRAGTCLSTVKGANKGSWKAHVWSPRTGLRGVELLGEASDVSVGHTFLFPFPPFSSPQ